MMTVEQVDGQTRITLVLGATKLAMSIAMAASGIALAMQ